MWTTDTAKAALAGYVTLCPRGHILDLAPAVEMCRNCGREVVVVCKECMKEHMYEASSWLAIHVLASEAEKESQAPERKMH